jgi:hypothetical protein
VKGRYTEAVDKERMRSESMDVCRSIRAAAKEALGYLDIPDDKTPEPQKQVYDLLTNIKLLAAYFEDKLEAEI